MPPIRTIRTAVLGGFGIGAAIGGPLLIAYSVWALQAPTSAAFDRCQEVCDPILVGAVLALQGAWYSALVGAVLALQGGLVQRPGRRGLWCRQRLAVRYGRHPVVVSVPGGGSVGRAPCDHRRLRRQWLEARHR
jgi:hypothetical protein